MNFVFNLNNSSYIVQYAIILQSFEKYQNLIIKSEFCVTRKDFPFLFSISILKVGGSESHCHYPFDTQGNPVHHTGWLNNLFYKKPHDGQSARSPGSWYQWVG